MKTRFFAGVSAILMLASCAGNKPATEPQSEPAAEPVADVDMVGQWFIENIVLSDSMSVRPAEVTPDAQQYFTFTDTTYSIITNCNTIFGAYTLSGDSITFGAGGMTRMMCDNTASEDALNQILPNIVVVDVENDTIARLNSSDAAQYIVLRKNTGEEIK